MEKLEIWSGIGLIAVTVVLLSPLWLPRLWSKYLGSVRATATFLFSAPERLATAQSHWRGAHDDRRKFAFSMLPTVLGACWVYWIFDRSELIAEQPGNLQMLFVCIAFATFAGTCFSICYGCRVVSWTWIGFWYGTPSPATDINPVHRVGIAAPLGEAEFAKAREIDAALQGRGGHFQPPQFRD